MIWRAPDVPSLLVTYITANDLFQQELADIGEEVARLMALWPDVKKQK